MKLLLHILLTAGVAVSAFGQDFATRGKGALAAGDTSSAVSLLQQALKAGDRSAEVSALLGAIEFNRKKYREAVPYLESAIKQNEENIDAITMLGRSLLAVGDVKGALKALRPVEKIGRKNPAALTAYGEAYLAADSVDAAIRQLTLAKEYDATNGRIPALLGDCYLKQNVPPLAVMNYQRAIELNPKDIDTRMKLGRVYERQQNYTDAVKEYDEVTSQDSTRADAYFAKGKILVRAKLYERAVAPLQRFAALDTKSAEGAALYARALHGSGDYTAAEKEAKRALGLDSTNNDVVHVLAESQLQLKDYAGAVASYQILKRRNAFMPEDQAGYGSALVGAGREDEAISALLAAVKEDSTNCDPYYQLGSIYMRKQEWASAAEMFEKRIACDSRSLGSYLNAAACYYQPTVKNYPRMRAMLEKAIELKPDWLLARLWMGRYYTAVDSLSKAKDEYDEVLKAVGTATDKRSRDIAGEAEYMIGQYYFALQQYDKATDACRRASNLGYENFSLRMTWGQALLQTLNPRGDQSENRRKIDEATKHFRRASEMDPNSAAAHLWLAQSLVLSRVEGDDEGNRKLQEEACAEYRKALRIDPKNEDAKKGMERIGCPGASR